MSEQNITFQDYPEYKIAVILWKYLPPILLIIGTVANSLSIVVLLQPSLRKCRTMFYLLVLSFADICGLYTGLLRFWLKYTFDVDFRLLSEFGCKLHGFLVYVILDFTAWVLVAVTVDRCLCVCFPFKSRKWCTMTSAKIALSTIAFVLILINIHMFWTLGILHVAEETQCIGLYEFNYNIWPWIDFSVFCFIPFIVMISCNIMLVRHLVLSFRKLKRHELESKKFNMLSNDQSDFDIRRKFRTKEVGNVSSETISQAREELSEAPLAPVNKEDSDETELKQDENNGDKNKQKKHNPANNNHVKFVLPPILKNKDENDKSKTKTASKTSQKLPSLTAMLLTVNGLFLVMTSPILIYLIGFPSWYVETSSHSRAKMSIFWAFANFSQYLNNTIHFFLYCLTCPKFKREFNRLLKMPNKVNVVLKTES